MLARTCLLAPLLACAMAVPALAQTTQLTNYPACTGTPSAQDSEAAHNAFLLGQRFFNEADYGSALHNFVDAYKIDCTKTILLTFIARANELAGNKADAVHALETYLDRAPNVAPEDKAQIQKRIDNLKAQIAAQLPAAVPSAPVAPTVVAPPPTVAPPPQGEERHHTVAPWIVAGIGGAAAVAGVAMLIVGYSQYESALALCPGNNCMGQQAPMTNGNNALDLEHIAIGVLVGGAAVAAGGLIWHFVEPTGPAEKRASVIPVVGPGYAGVAGRF